MLKQSQRVKLVAALRSDGEYRVLRRVRLPEAQASWSPGSGLAGAAIDIETTSLDLEGNCIKSDDSEAIGAVQSCGRRGYLWDMYEPAGEGGASSFDDCLTIRAPRFG